MNAEFSTELVVVKTILVHLRETFIRHDILLASKLKKKKKSFFIRSLY